MMNLDDGCYGNEVTKNDMIKNLTDFNDDKK